MLATVAGSGLLCGAGCLNRESESDPSPPGPDDVDCDPADHPSLATRPSDGSWEITRGNQQRTGATSVVKPLGLAEMGEWKVTELVSHSSLYIPAIVDGTVYCNDGDSTLYAVDGMTGETHWTLNLNGIFTPLVTADTVYTFGVDTLLHAIDRESGEHRWIRQLDSETRIDTLPLVAGENVIVGHERGLRDETQGWFTAVDMRCGSERWSFATPKGESTQGLATDGSAVYAATEQHLYAVDTDEGDHQWRIKLPEDVSFDYRPALLCAGNTIVGGGENRYLVAIDRNDGSIRWTTRDDLYAKHFPTAVADKVFVVERETENVIALNLQTGAREWIYRGVDFNYSVPPTYVSGYLYGIEGSSPMLALNAKNGGKHAESPLPSINGTHLDMVEELAITPAGIFIHSHRSEGGNPDYIHRLVPA